MHLLALLAVVAGLAAPTLRVVSDQPLVVRGTGFGAGEALVVRVYGKTVTTTSVHASSTGAFRVRLVRPEASLPCGRLLVRVTRAAGTKVAVLAGPRECAPTD
jgi:hypothetical protein